MDDRDKRFSQVNKTVELHSKSSKKPYLTIMSINYSRKDRHAQKLSEEIDTARCVMSVDQKGR